MAVLSKADILERIEDGSLSITPFSEGQLEPASYDLSIGRAIKAGKDETHSSADGRIIIEPNNWAMIGSKEIVTLPTTLCASYGVTSSITRAGLMYFGGPQIDPGYTGGIFVSVYNPTLEPIVLDIGQQFFTIIFHTLSSEAEPYCGRYQNQNDFPSCDVERMLRMKTKDLSHVIRQVDVMEQTLNLLTDDVHSIRKTVEEASSFFKTVSRYKKIIFPILGFILLAVAGFFLEEVYVRFLKPVVDGLLN